MNLTNEQMIETMHQECLAEFQAGGDPLSTLYIHKKDLPEQIIKIDYSGKSGMPREVNRKLIQLFIHKIKHANMLGGVCFVGNAWRIELDSKGITKEEAKKKMADETKDTLANHPNRIESLFIVAYQADGTKGARMWNIKRDEAGKFTELEALKPMDGYEGWLDTAFTTAEKILAEN